MEKRMETNYNEEVVQRLHQAGLLDEVAASNEIREMLSEHPDIWEISYDLSIERSNEKAHKGTVMGTVSIKNVVVITGATKCESCDEYFLKTREWAKFCSDKCRQASFREKNKKDINS